MQKEYDFSNAERGRFYSPDATLQPPIYLEPEVLSYLTDRAKKTKALDSIHLSMNCLRRILI